jgi:hypothetical protein
MQQMLVLLADDADAATVGQALDNASGNVNSFLSPNVAIVNGDENVRTALTQTTGVLAVLSDEDAKTAANATDITQMALGDVATWVGTTLGTNQTYEEPIVQAIAGWIYGQSDAYVTAKSDRPRQDESWDTPGGCTSTDDFANA